MFANNKVKIAAVALPVALICVLGAISADASPDEWMAGKGPYLGVCRESDAGPESGSLSRETCSYTVQKGDTVLSVASRFGVTASSLVSINNLKDENYIREGQILQVPGRNIVHEVAPGETLTCIAVKTGVSAREISAVNNLVNEDMLIAGQKLIIPGGAVPAGGFSAREVSRGLPVGDLDWPVAGRVSSPFGFRDGKPHEGIDIAADEGSPIKAAMSGRVSFAGPRGTYGLTVILDHGEGLGTLYAHSSKIMVSQGEWVNKGQVIGLVGSTGRSTGPHLHLELLMNGLPYDPMICLKGEGL